MDNSSETKKAELITLEHELKAANPKIFDGINSKI